LAALVGLALSATPAAAQSQQPPPSVLLSLQRAESAIAIDPLDPQTMAVAANPTYRFNAQGQEPIGIFVTRDGGRRWTAIDAPMAPPFVIGSDPSVAFGSDGALYVGFEAVSGGFCGSVSNTAVMVDRSADSGRSFQPPVIVDANPANDKPSMTAGPGNAVYVSWIRFYSDAASQIAFARSLDGAMHFSAPALISTGPGLHVAPMPAGGTGNQVTVAWLAYAGTIGATVPQRIETRTSFDAGKHFGTIAHTVSFPGLPGIEQPGSLRLFNGPSLAVRSPKRMYVAWEQQHAGASTTGAVSADIMLSRSSDGGRHWSGPIALNDSARGDRLEPQIAVSRDGTIVAAFYDRRRDGVNLDLELAVARDTGAALRLQPNIQLTADPSPIAAIPFIPPGSPCLAQGRFFGDYLGVAEHQGQAAIAWTASTDAYPRQTQIRFTSMVLPRAATGDTVRYWAPA
jgi:hypothetical protein